MRTDPDRSGVQEPGLAAGPDLTLIADALEERMLLAVPLVTDHGGSILQNVQVETVYWNWNTPALMTMANQLNTLRGRRDRQPVLERSGPVRRRFWELVGRV